MDFVRRPLELSSEGSMATNWKHWKHQFQVFLKASGKITEPTDVKACLLLNLIGPIGEQAYRNFDFDSQDGCEDLDILMKKFDDHFDPKATETQERYTFFTSVRQETETIDQYVETLKYRAKTCDFGVLSESLIRDKIILDMKNKTLRKQLLNASSVSLTETIDRWKSCEEKTKLAILCLPKILQDTQIKTACGSQSHDKTVICKRCGTFHSSNKECSAIGQTCGNCGMVNHLAKVCNKPAVAKNHLKTALKSVPVYFNPGPITKVPGLNQKTVYE